MAQWPLRLNLTSHGSEGGGGEGGKFSILHSTEFCKFNSDLSENQKYFKIFANFQKAVTWDCSI